MLPPDSFWEVADDPELAEYNVGTALAIVRGEPFNRSELQRLIEERGANYVSFWAAWLPRKVAAYLAAGKTVKNPAALLQSAIERRWQVDPSWPEYDVSEPATTDEQFEDLAEQVFGSSSKTEPGKIEYLEPGVIPF